MANKKNVVEFVIKSQKDIANLAETLSACNEVTNDWLIHLEWKDVATGLYDNFRTIDSRDYEGMPYALVLIALGWKSSLEDENDIFKWMYEGSEHIIKWLKKTKRVVEVKLIS